MTDDHCVANEKWLIDVGWSETKEANFDFYLNQKVNCRNCRARGNIHENEGRGKVTVQDTQAYININFSIYSAESLVALGFIDIS